MKVRIFYGRLEAAQAIMRNHEYDLYFSLSAVFGKPYRKDVWEQDPNCFFPAANYESRSAIRNRFEEIMCL